MRPSPLDITGLERLRAADATLGGELPRSSAFLHWLQAAVRIGRVSVGREGFYLTASQAEYWAGRGVRAP